MTFLSFYWDKIQYVAHLTTGETEEEKWNGFWGHDFSLPLQPNKQKNQLFRKQWIEVEDDFEIGIISYLNGFYKTSHPRKKWLAWKKKEKCKI